MTEAKFTKGPWSTGEIGMTANCVYAKDTRLTANCNSAYRDKEQQKANAMLISQAPELLEIAKAVIKWDFRNRRDSFKSWAKEIVAKAEGK